MSFTQEKLDVETYIAANVTGTSLVFENVTHKSGVLDWVRVNILNSNSRQVSMGDAPYFRYRGLLIFQVFTKPNIGSGRSVAIVDQLSSLFRGKRIGTLTFDSPMLEKIGEQDSWYQVNLTIPFSREET